MDLEDEMSLYGGQPQGIPTCGVAPVIVPVTDAEPTVPLKRVEDLLALVEGWEAEAGSEGEAGEKHAYCMVAAELRDIVEEAGK